MLVASLAASRGARPSSWGRVLGRIELPAVALERAAEMAAAHYRDAVAADFCQQPVETALVPGWLPARGSWWPREVLQRLGWRRAEGLVAKREELVMTVGVDPHIDRIHGPALCLVLHNDGLTFQQGRGLNTARPGEWFLFDDRRCHGVEPTPESTAFVGWVVPIQR